MKASSLSLPARFFLLFLLGAVWFVQLGYRDLSDPDEGRYAEIPYEMFATGDWLTPRLNGFKYFEKPPLQYWGTAAFYEGFGVNNATSRLWCASLGFLGILWVTWLGGRLFGPDAGFFAGLTLAGSLLYAAMGHMNTLDMGVAFFISVGMGALAWAQSRREDPRHVRRWMLVAWAALAGATLSKGLIGLLLPAASVTLYTLWQRDFALWKHMHWGKGLLLFLLLTAPWFVAVSIQNPEFPEFFFIHEHFARYTTDVHGRTGHVLYFIPIFLLGSLPWLTHALGVLFKPTFAWFSSSRAFDPQRLLWTTIVFILVFFSFSHAKLIPYILPAFPALALLMGVRLARASDFKWDLLLMAGVATLLLVVGSVMVSYLHNSRNPPEALMVYRPWVFAAAAVLILSLLLIYWTTKCVVEQSGKTVRCYQGPLTASILAVGSLLAFQLLGWGYQSTNRVHSTRLLVEAITPYVNTEQAGEAGAPVFCVHCFYPSLPFYRQSTIQVVHYVGELAFGVQQEPEKWIADFPTFLARWEATPHAVAVLQRSEVAKWQARGMRMHTIYEDVARIAVTHPP